MKTTVIETIEHSIPQVTLRGEKKYTFTDTGPFVRLKRWLWERWGKPFADTKIVATRHLIDIYEEEIGDLISRALNKLGLHASDVEYVIMGPGDAVACEDQMMARRCLHFPIPMTEDYRGFRYILGIKVRIIPWVNEIIIIPKDHVQ